MCSVLDSCFICSNTSDYTVVNNEIVQQLEYVLPLNRDVKMVPPLRICRSCSEVIPKIRNFTQESVSICRQPPGGADTKEQPSTSPPGHQHDEGRMDVDSKDLLVKVKSEQMDTDQTITELEIVQLKNENKENVLCCPLCHTKFQSKCNLDYHLKTHEQVKTCQCLECGKTFALKSLWKYHTHGHSTRMVQETTTSQLEEKEDITHKKENKETKRNCPLCNEAFTQKDDLIKHVKSHNDQTRIQITKEIQKSKQCPICDKIFTTFFNVRKHIQLHIGSKHFRSKPTSLENKEINIIYDKPRPCPICTEEFSQSTDMIRHVKIHIGLKKFSKDINKLNQCPICDRVLKQSCYMTPHIKKHMGIKDYECSICKSLFTTRHGLEYHVTTHTGVKNYKCPICNMSFRTNVLLRQHMRHINDEKHLQALAENIAETKRIFREMCIKNARNNEYLSDSDHCNQNSEISVKEDSIDETDEDRQIYKTILQEIKTEPYTDTENTLSEPMDQEDELSNTDIIMDNETYIVYDKPRTCPICNAAFSQSLDMIKHVKTHKAMKKIVFKEGITKLDQCPICDVAVNNRCNMGRHIKRHIGVKNFECSICKKLYRTKDSLEYHMPSHTGIKKFKCPVCNGFFQTNQTLRKHMKSKNDDRHLQALAENGAKRRKKVQEIYIKNEPIDDYSSNSKESTDSKIKVKTEPHRDNKTMEKQAEHLKPRLKPDSEISIAYETPRSCPVCYELFSHSDDMLKHVKIHKGMRKIQFSTKINKSKQCPICEQDLSRSNMGRHIRRHIGIKAKDYECSLCDKRYKSKSSLKFHMTSHTGLRQFKCPVCKKSFQTNKIMREHMRRKKDDKHNQALKDMTAERTYNFEEIYVKNELNYETSEDRQIDEEESETKTKQGPQFQTQEDEKPRKCPVCKQEFTQSDLYEHIKSHVGINKLPYDRELVRSGQCPVCDKVFKHASCNLMRHIKAHIGMKEVHCFVCGKAFTSKGSLDYHLAIHKNMSHVCSVCKRSFRTRSVLGKHLRANSDDEHKKALEEMDKNKSEDSTEVSNRLFTNATSDVINVRNVSNVSNVNNGQVRKCPVCGETFTQADDLEKHLKQYKDIGKLPFTEECLESKQCPLCDKVFASSKYIKRHVTLHLQFKTFHCMECNKSFSSNQTLRVHMATQKHKQKCRSYKVS